MSKMSESLLTVDRYGRIEPSASLESAAHAISRNYFKFSESRLTLSESYNTLRKLYSVQLDQKVFLSRIEALCVKAGKLLGLDTNTVLVCAPFYLPKLQHEDLGTELEEVYLPLIRTSYKNTFPDYEFTVEYKDSLKDKLKSIKGLGHDRLEDLCRDSDVMGVTFFILREYSVKGAREQMAFLPEEFSLAGILDLSGALVAQPDLMFNETEYSPMVWPSGCETPWEHANFHYECYGYNLMFNRRVHHDLVAEYWSHGISLFEPV